MSYFEELLDKMTQKTNNTPTKKTKNKTVTKKKKNEEEESLIDEFVRETYGKFKTVGEANLKNGVSTIFSDTPTKVGGGGRSFSSTTEKDEEEDKREFLGLDLFQKSGAWDGYEPGKVTDVKSFFDEANEFNKRHSQATLGTMGDVALNILQGGLNFAEGIGDVGGYLIAEAHDLFGADEAAKEIKKNVQQDAFGMLTQPLHDAVEKTSWLGETTDQVGQGVGQVLATMGIGAIGKAAGATPKVMSFLSKLAQGTSAFGNAMSEAYKGGATDGEALGYGAISATAEVLFESLFDGMGKTAKSLGFDDISLTNGADDWVASKVSSFIKNPQVKNVVQGLVKGGFEGVEELLTGFVQGSAKKIYDDEKTWGQLLKDENLWEQFFVGMLTGDLMQAGDVTKANKSGRDLITGLNADETTVVNKIVDERIEKKAKETGKELTGKQKAEIREQAMEDLENGSLDVDDIERILGGDSYTAFDEAVKGFEGNETYKAYKDALAEEKALQSEFDELSKVKSTEANLGQNARFNELQQKLAELKQNSKSGELRTQLQPEIDRINQLKAKARADSIGRLKDSKLTESYRELQRSAEKFKVDDFSKYKGEHSQKTINNILASGLMNNSNKMHKFVDFLAKISDAKGVTFSLTDAKKMAGTIHDMKGAVANAFVNGSEITLNMDSKNVRETVVGHEITHVLEGTEFYDTLANAVKRYAMSKGEWDSRLADVTELYKKHDPNADPVKELVADLVGEYVFTDKNFVTNLSTDKNVFKRVWNEIKWLAKIATAGSEEARNLVEAKRIFEMVWRESNTKTDNTVKHSISEDGEYGLHDSYDLSYEETGYGRVPDSLMGFVGNGKTNKGFENENYPYTLKLWVSNDGGHTFWKDEIKGMNRKHALERARRNWNDSGGGEVVLKDRTADKDTGWNDNTKYSISDSNGNQLSDAQQDFFKDSVVRDENGKLKVMYHGTSKGGHTVFDTYGGQYGLFGVGSYFTDSKTIGESYTKKGRGTNPQVYESYLNIKNPIDMDAEANPAEWAKEFPEVNFPQSGTNEDFYRAVEQYCEDEMMYKWEAADMIRECIEEMGYDGITHIGGGRVNADGEKHRVYIAFNPEQIKRTDNVNPTSDPDIRYSISEDSDGNKLTEEQNEFFKDSVMRDENGNLKVMYHGTQNGGFHTFMRGYSDDDISFFFVDDNGVASSYSGTSETYTAQTFRTADDFNRFFNEIGAREYSVVEENGKFKLLEDGDEIAENDTADGLYEDFRDWSGKGYGEVNYKVYLNLKNPLVVDADGADWNALPNVSGDSQQYEYIKMLEVGDDGKVTIEYAMVGDPAPVTERVDLYQKFEDNLADTLANLEPGESLEGAYANPSTTRDYAKYAKENGYDGVIFKNIYDVGGYGNNGASEATVAIAFDSNQIKSVGNPNPTTDNDIRYSLSEPEVQETNDVLKDIGVELDGNSGTVSYSLSSLEDAFGIEKGGILDDYTTGEDYLRAREEYVEALVKATGRTKEECDRYLDSLFLVGEMIANDKDRLDYEAAVNKSAWVSNAEYGGSIDFSTLCAKRRLFTGTFDAIQEALPDTVLNDNDFLRIRNMLLAKELESPCSMCYVEGSRAKHGEYVAKFLKDYLATNPAWKPQIADFTSTTMLEQTRINHPEAYKAYQDAMNKLAQRKPKEASVRTDYKGEILVAFEDGSSVEIKNENGGIRFNSFSDFEIIHALDCMQVLTDMARVGLNGQAYTKVAAFAEAFGNTGLKINLSLVAKDVDANGKLIYDEVNGMKYAEANDIRNRFSDNVGTVIVVFNEAQLKAALADSTIDYVLPFHRSQWKKSQYTMMGLPVNTRDFTNLQNDRVKNPKTGRPVKLSKIKHIANYVNDLTGKSYEVGDNIMPNQYWDYTKSGRENAQRYLDYINSNNLIPKFNFLLENVNGKWTLPADAIGDGYFKLLIDFKMYNNEGVGTPQRPVVPEFNMPYITDMLDAYKGGHKSFPVAHDVVDEFVNGKKNGKFSLTADEDVRDAKGDSLAAGKVRSQEDFGFNPFEDIAPVADTAQDVQNTADVPFDAPVTNPPEQTFAPPANSLPPTEDNSFDAPVNEAPVNDDGYMDSLVASEPPPAMFDAPVREDAPKQDQQTPQILTEEKPRLKKKTKILHKLVELLVDKGAVFERLSKKTKNRELEAKYNYMHYSEAKAQKLIGEGDAERGIRSLTSIAEQVGERTKDFYTYLYHILNMDRMSLRQRGFGENKAVFGSNVTAQMSSAIAQRIEAQNPDFRQLATEVYGINQHLRQMLVDGGIITQETANRWAQMYPHYVPISRADHETLVEVQQDNNKAGVNAPVKRATGGDGNISPLFNTMASRILQTYKAVDKNSFGLELMRTLGTVRENSATDMDGIMEAIDTHENLLQVSEDGTPTFSVFANGQRVKFAIDKEMYDALSPTNETYAYTNTIANGISNFRRGLITEYNPVFLATNALKDAQDVLINSQHPLLTYANMPRAIAQMIGKGKWFKEYMANGGEQNTYFEKDSGKLTKEKSKVRKILGFPLDAIAYANNFIERVPRLAEYIASREHGRSIEVAMLDAARVTTNFAAGGDVTKLLNRNGFTFLNASVQGATQQVRNVAEAVTEGKKGVLKLIGKTVLAGLPAVLLNGLFWDDDEEYEELSDYVKENYYIVGKLGDGQFVRIPKGRTVAVVQEAFEQMKDAITGDDDIDFMKWAKLAFGNLAPNDPMNNFFLAPFIQASTNTAWHGGEIVPQSLQDVPEAEQYDESTDMFSRWVGDVFNISPMKVNYVLDQYSGGVGDLLLPMMTPEAERGEDSILGKLASPWVDKFTTDSTLNNQNVTDFYDLKDELTINANSSKATDNDLLMSSYMNSISSELNALYKEKREIQNSRMSDAEKFAEARRVQQEIVDTMKNAMSTYEGISYKRDAKTGEQYALIGDKVFKRYNGEYDHSWRILDKEQTEKYRITSAAGNANYATDGTTHYAWYVPDEDTLDKDPAWRKLTEKQVDKMNTVARKVGITPEEYWTNRDEDSVKMYDWVYENPEKVTVAKAVADDFNDYWKYRTDLNGLDGKDDNGNSVNGLKKQRITEYISGLDIDYGQKIILFRSYYPKDDSYCYDIVDYLNNRNDISYRQMVTILEELDMKVHDDGTVTWD